MSDYKKFYNSKRWRKVRLNQLQTDPLCADCLKLGYYVSATQVDHIKSMRSGGHPTDPENLRSLCISCHSRKTAREDHGFGHAKSTKPMKGCGLDGLPIDDTHPWYGGRVES